MELFGKEINIDLDKKKVKLLILIGTGVGVLLLIYFLVLSPIQRVFSKKEELAKVKKEKVFTDKNLKLFKKRYEQSEFEKENQKYRLEELLEEFRSHNLKDEARLKQMIQEILNHLNIELIEIGKTETEIIEEKNEYQRKMIPYRIVGNSRDVALFFYYLENSKTLLTLKNSRLEVVSKPFDSTNEKNGIIEVKFKIGYYKILEDKGGGDEK